MTQHRRLVLMFDGTWDEKDDWTNVARMAEAIDCVADNEVEEAQNSDVEPKPVQLVKYLEGVGTAWFGKLLGGSFGYGLSEIIEEGYLWLSNQYLPGDEIFVFGFSRGAYSARSLVSLVHRCGGVLTKKPGGKPRELSDPLLKAAYGLYRGYAETTDAANAAYDKKLKAFGAENCESVRVRMLGVWDTVGALGVPDSAFKSKNPLVAPILHILGSKSPLSRSHYQFHGQGLSCIVDEAYHALAIDEHREDFAPTLWDSRTPENKAVEQCWFVGSHCNVGGGCKNDDLWQLSYEWMQNNAIACGLRFKWLYTAGDQWSSWRTTPEDSYHKFVSGLYALTKTPFDRVVGANAAESLHASVKLRIENNPKYQPNGLAIIPSDPKKFRTEIPYVQLPVQICSCHKYNSTTVTDSATTKKDP